MTAPEITFLMTAFEQEAYVGEAVRSILAQDCAPLEIILSDDGSGDGTYAIIEHEAATYRGPHIIRLNRNPENLGSVAHLNKLMTMARGRFIVLGHGDDVAHAGRARALTEAWTRRRASLVTSNAIMTDAALRPQGRLSAMTKSGGIVLDTLIARMSHRALVGATMAWDRDLFDRFGPIKTAALPLGPADQLLPIRAGLLKGVWFIAQPLLRYRRHERNMSHDFFRGLDRPAQSEARAARRLTVLMCVLEELVAARNRGDDSETFRDGQRKLQRAIIDAVHEWTRIRNGLLAIGRRPTWLSDSALKAIPVDPRDRFRPEAETVAGDVELGDLV